MKLQVELLKRKEIYMKIFGLIYIVLFVLCSTAFASGYDRTEKYEVEIDSKLTFKDADKLNDFLMAQFKRQFILESDHIDAQSKQLLRNDTTFAIYEFAEQRSLIIKSIKNFRFRKVGKSRYSNTYKVTGEVKFSVPETLYSEQMEDANQLRIGKLESKVSKLNALLASYDNNKLAQLKSSISRPTRTHDVVDVEHYNDKIESIQLIKQEEIEFAKEVASYLEFIIDEHLDVIKSDNENYVTYLAQFEPPKKLAHIWNSHAGLIYMDKRISPRSLVRINHMAHLLLPTYYLEISDIELGQVIDSKPIVMGYGGSVDLMSSGMSGKNKDGIILLPDYLPTACDSSKEITAFANDEKHITFTELYAECTQVFKGVFRGAVSANKYRKPPYSDLPLTLKTRIVKARAFPVSNALFHADSQKHNM